MAKVKTVKKETVKRIKDIVSKFNLGSPEEVVKCEKYSSLFDNYMNSVEKEFASIIIDGCLSNFTFDEILLTVNAAKEVAEHEEAEKKSPVEAATEEIFMISQQKVVEVPNVDVVIEAATATTEPVSEVVTETVEATAEPATETVEATEPVSEVVTETVEATEPVFMATEKKVVDVVVEGNTVSDTPVAKVNKKAIDKKNTSDAEVSAEADKLVDELKNSVEPDEPKRVKYKSETSAIANWWNNSGLGIWLSMNC